jgi:hypothetical protein
MRAKRENSSTIRLSCETSETIVFVPSSMACGVSASALRNFLAIRSAESWIGVSGFLISCAMRFAASFHAASFCACTSCVESSIATTQPARLSPLRRAAETSR